MYHLSYMYQKVHVNTTFLILFIIVLLQFLVDGFNLLLLSIIVDRTLSTL